jgi:hypothetical protein
MVPTRRVMQMSVAMPRVIVIIDNLSFGEAVGDLTLPISRFSDWIYGNSQAENL